MPPRITVDAVVFRQGEEPNRNFVRFKAGVLRSLAKSFVGAPFLRDHEQRDLGARGGKVLASEFVGGEGTGEIRQTIELAAPWAIEAIGRGLIDRFSIGWSNTDEVVCSECAAPFFKSIFGSMPGCDHMPGDVVEARGGGKRAVEMVVTGADGVETSAVTVPAVNGTGVEAIRAALAAERRMTGRGGRYALGGQRAGALNGKLAPAGCDGNCDCSCDCGCTDAQPCTGDCGCTCTADCGCTCGCTAGMSAHVATRKKTKEPSMYTKLAATLGVAADAGEDMFLTALARIQGDAEKTSALLAAEREAHAAVKARETALATELATVRRAEDEKTLERILGACRGKVGQKLGADGHAVRGGTAAEQVVIKLAAHDIKAAEDFVAELAQVMPISEKHAAIKRIAVDQDEARLSLDESQRRINHQLGISDADFAKFAPSAQRGI